MEGLEEQVNTLKESHDYLFDSDSPKPLFTGGINPPKGNLKDTLNFNFTGVRPVPEQK